MSRKIGFGEGGGTARAGGPPARPMRRILLTTLALCLMGGIGGALALDALRDGNVVVFAVGTVWCVALVTIGASKLIKQLLGLDGPRKDPARHDWSLDGEDR